MAKGKYTRVPGKRWSAFTLVLTMLFMLTVVLLVLLALGIFSLPIASDDFSPNDLSAFRRKIGERASDFSREYDGACLQMRMSYSPAAHPFLFLVQWTDCHLAGALGLLRILIYKLKRYWRKHQIPTCFSSLKTLRIPRYIMKPPVQSYGMAQKGKLMHLFLG